MSAARRPHISPSQIDMYLRCGEQWRRRYLCGEVIPPGIALIKGSAVHKAAEVNFEQKIASRTDLPLTQLCEAAAEHVDATIRKDGLFLTPEEETIGAQKVIGQIKDSAVTMTGAFVRGIAPRIQPAMVEKFITIPIPNCSHDLLGRLDIATEGDEVVDLKTSSRKKTQEDIDRSDQLTFYDAAFEYETGRPCKGLSLEVVIETKIPTTQTLRSTRGPKDRGILVAKINTILAGVKAGVFLPAASGAWCCSPRFCGYWHTCPFVDAERKAAAEATANVWGGPNT
jgi:hypothetical protein